MPSTQAEVPQLFAPEFVQDPYRSYARLRAAGPVSRVRWPDGSLIWLVTGLAEARALLQDDRLRNGLKHSGTDMSSMLALPADVLPYFALSLLRTDPPEHAAQRRRIGRAFTARRVAELRDRVHELAHGMLDKLAATGGEADLIDRFCMPLSSAVIAELLGVAPAGRAEFRRRTDAFMTASPNDPEAVGTAARELVAYGQQLVAATAERPGDDLLSALVTLGRDDPDFGPDQQVALVLDLIGAGYETTANLIGNAVHALLLHRDQWDLLVQDQVRVPAAVEELLRFCGPAEISSLRYPVEPVTVAGVTLAAGEPVAIALCVADRDPEHVHEPDRLDLRRSSAGHLAFGHGAHFCPGAPLSRLEAEVALEALVRRFPAMTLAVPASQLRWRPTLLRGQAELPVRLC